MAAELGDADAQFSLNHLLLTADTTKSVSSDRISGHADALFNLGLNCATGRGVQATNNVRALNWFLKAAEQGHAKAQDFLGFYYANGIDVSADVNEAVRWYRMAAEQGACGSTAYSCMLLC